MVIIPTTRTKQRTALRTLLGLTVSACILVPAAGHAEELAAAEAVGGGEILVTARKRSESSQDVPIALNVVSGVEMDRKGLDQLVNIQREVPALHIFTTNPRNISTNIRGIGSGSTTQNIGIDAGVGFYIDEVYYPRLGPAVFNLVDIERVEVLRGPQGTLFGRNTTAGAVSIITRKPEFETAASAEVTVGNYGLVATKGWVTGAIIPDKLAGRLTFELSDRGGTITNIFNGEKLHDRKNITVRGQLLFTPSDNFSLRLIGDYSRNSQLCCQSLTTGYMTAYDDGTPLAFTASERWAQLNYTPLPVDPKARKTDLNGIRPFTNKAGGVSAQADWELGAHTLTSISAYRYWKTNPRNDSDKSSLSIRTAYNQPDDQRQFSQELRLSSNDGGPLNYVFGLYYFWQNHKGDLHQAFGSDAGLYYNRRGRLGLTDAQLLQALDGAYTHAPQSVTTNSYAAFGQATWEFSPGTSLTAGLRYSYERKRGSFEQYRGTTQDVTTFTPDQLTVYYGLTPVVGYYEARKSWGSLTGNVTLSHKFSDDIMVYGTYSHGAKSGGINVANLPKKENGDVQSGLAIVAPEKADNYEIGIKSSWLDGRITANLAAFLIDLSNYQSSLAVNYNGSYSFYISNVGKVRSKGIEFDLRANPVDALSLYGSVAYTDAKYRDYKDAACPFEKRPGGAQAICDLSGKDFPSAPHWTLAGGGEVRAPLSDRLLGYLGTDVSYKSRYNTSYNLSRYTVAKSATLVDLRVGVRPEAGGWEATVWVRNVFDSQIERQNLDETDGTLTAVLRDPRTYGATFRYNF